MTSGAARRCGWLAALLLIMPAARAAAQERGAQGEAQERPPQARPPAGGTAAGTAAERQARADAAAKAFFQDQYQEALDIFLDLYLKGGGRPEYLRNIGRCQQKLGMHAQAIDSFKDYLRRAKRLSAEEQKEVREFIAESERAKTAGAASGSTAAPPAATGAPAVGAAAPAAPAASSTSPPASPGSPPAPPAGSAAAPPLTPPPAEAPAPSLIATQPVPPPSPPRRRTSVLKIGGVVALAAAGVAVVGGTLALMKARSAYDDARNDSRCGSSDPADDCANRADSVRSWNRISQGLYIGAAVVGAGGLTMILMAPASGAERSVSLGLGARIAY
jgi:hypothetical protein